MSGRRDPFREERGQQAAREERVELAAAIVGIVSLIVALAFAGVSIWAIVQIVQWLVAK